MPQKKKKSSKINWGVIAEARISLLDRVFLCPACGGEGYDLDKAYVYGEDFPCTKCKSTGSRFWICYKIKCRFIDFFRKFKWR